MKYNMASLHTYKHINYVRRLYKKRTHNLRTYNHLIMIYPILYCITYHLFINRSDFSVNILQ